MSVAVSRMTITLIFEHMLKPSKVKQADHVAETIPPIVKALLLSLTVVCKISLSQPSRCCQAKIMLWLSRKQTGEAS